MVTHLDPLIRKCLAELGLGAVLVAVPAWLGLAWANRYHRRHKYSTFVCC